MARETTQCQRCKVNSIKCSTLHFKTDERESSVVLCDVCLAASRQLWIKFMTVEPDVPTLTDENSMSFGMHKGKKLKDVPAQYLIWCGDQAWITQKPSLHRYIEKNRDLLEIEIEEDKGND